VLSYKKNNEEQMSEPTKEQEEIETRARLFDKEFQELQHKYKLRAVAQVVFPTGQGTPPAIMNVPILLMPISSQAPTPIEPNLTDPTA
jgi:hypothetical protein